MSAMRLTKMFFPRGIGCQSMTTTGPIWSVEEVLDMYEGNVLLKKVTDVEPEISFRKINLLMFGFLFLVYDKDVKVQACSYGRRGKYRSSVALSYMDDFFGFYALYKLRTELSE